MLAVRQVRNQMCNKLSQQRNLFCLTNKFNERLFRQKCNVSNVEKGIHRGSYKVIFAQNVFAFVLCVQETSWLLARGGIKQQQNKALKVIT